MATSSNLPVAIQGLQKENPKLYEAMKSIWENLETINKELFPLIQQAVNTALDLPVAAPINFTYEVLSRGIKFDWDDVLNAGGYEIRLGDTWENSSFVLRTISSEAIIDPILVGTYTYLIKTINRAGNYSPNFTSLSVTINQLGLVHITAQVIDNNVLLTWTNAITQFQLDYYLVTKDGNEIGRLSGTFISIFENAAGEYIYGVSAVDIAGNIGPQSTITAQVNQPPDFVLEDTLMADFRFPEDMQNVHINGINADAELIVCVITGRSWREHFEDNSWTTIRDQVNAGYPIYAEPAETSGYYQYVFDFGAIFENVIIGIEWLEQAIDGDINITAEISYSDDGITYTTPEGGTQLFALSMRYARVKMIFTPDDDKSISDIIYLKCFINVKREMDGGTVDVFAADVSGTPVNFNKAFKDVESITATPQTTVSQTPVIEFVDIPNPTTFSIYLFDDTGTRIDGTVAWKARGIL